MNTRKKKKLQKNLRKAARIFLPAAISLCILAIAASGYFYFFESHIKADYYFSKAQALDDENKYGSREAVKYYAKAIASYEAIGDRGAAVNAYIDLGLLHHKFGNIIQVERMVLSAIEIGGEEIPLPMKAKAYMLLASTVEPEKAKGYIKQAIDISDSLGQRVMTIKSYLILAKIYQYQAAFEESKNVYLKAIRVAENITKEDGFFDPELLYSDLAELYEGEGNIGLAINYYEKAMNAARNNAEHGIAIAIYMKTLGDLYNQYMQTAKACENWNKSREEYDVIGKQPPLSVLELSISPDCQKLGSVDISHNTSHSG